MSLSNAHDSHPPEFERILYVPISGDRTGSVVTVGSTLSRLGFDLWKETAELVVLGWDARRARLGQMLSGFGYVPALGSGHQRARRKLISLLPERRFLHRSGATNVTSRSV